jgi:hypothetical protein
MKRLTLTILYFLSVCFHAWGQTGTFVPEGANPTRPRVLFNFENLPDIQAAVQQEPRRQVLAYLSNLAFGFGVEQNLTYVTRQNAARVALACSYLLALGYRSHLDSTHVYPLTEEERQILLQKAVDQLHHLVTDVEILTVNNLTTGSNNWQYDAAILTQSLTSYDLLAAMGYGDEILDPARQKLTDYLANYYRATSDTVEGLGPISFFDFVKNNLALKAAGALGLGGVVLGEFGSDDPYRRPRRWLETGLYVLDNCLWRDNFRQSEPDDFAGYAEGPWYFNYAFINCLPFIRALKRYWPYDDSLHAEFRGAARRVRNPFFDPAYERLYEWMIRTALPDGRMAPIDDSYLDKSTLVLSFLENPRYHIPADLSGFYPTQPISVGQLISAPLDWGPYYLSVTTPFSDFSGRQKNECFPRAGNAVFRSDFSSKATYLHVVAENGRARTQGSGHNQGDVTSFFLCQNAEILALDPGYVSWGQRHLVGNADNHNLILSGNCGPLIGSPFQANDADGFLNDFMDLPGLAAVEASTRYCSTDVRRDFVFAGEKTVFVYDWVDRGNTATHFRWQLHGNGRQGADPQAVGTFELADNGGIWRRPHAGLRVHVQSPEGCTLSTRLSPHEIAFNQTGEHTVLEARVNGQSRATYLAALAPFNADQPIPLVQAHPLTDAALTTCNGFVAFAQTQPRPQTYTLPGTPSVSTDALFALYNDASLFVRTSANGGYFHGPFRVERQNAGKIALTFSSGGTYRGFATSGQTFIFTPRAPEYVVGTEDWNYNPETGRLNLNFQESSYFEIGLQAYDDELQPVWPGDADNDGDCDVIDFFLTAAGYGAAGAVRTDAGTEWRAHQAGGRWNDSIAYRDTTLPARFLDANGDGHVNLFDLAVCVAHRGLTR